MKCWITGLLLLMTGIASNAQATDTLLVGYKQSPPFVVEENGRLSGPSVWLWERIAAENGLAFAYRAYTLDGLLRGLSAGTIDVGLSPLTITSERARSMDFSAPYYIAPSALLVPEESSWQRTLAFVRSFLSVNFFRALGALALVILLFGFLIWLFERRGNPEEFDRKMGGLWSGFWWSAVTMTTVGYGDKSPRTVGGRIVALIWMFTAIIIISGFTASIASSLTVSQIGSADNRLEDFKTQTIGTVASSSTDEWLRKNFFTDKQTYPTLNKLLGALDRGEIAVVGYDQPILQTLLAADTTDRYQLLDIEFNAQFYAMGMNRDLPDSLQRQIDIDLLQLTESRDWEVLLAEYRLH